MKKIITFLFCTAVVSSSFAQTGRRDWNDRNTIVVAYGNPNGNHRNHQRNDENDNKTYNIYQRDQQIQKISYQFDYRIQQVMKDCTLTRWEKRNAIRDLQTQKAQQINTINYQVQQCE